MRTTGSHPSRQENLSTNRSLGGHAYRRIQIASLFTPFRGEMSIASKADTLRRRSKERSPSWRLHLWLTSAPSNGVDEAFAFRAINISLLRSGESPFTHTCSPLPSLPALSKTLQSDDRLFTSAFRNCLYSFNENEEPPRSC